MPGRRHGLYVVAADRVSMCRVHALRSSPACAGHGRPASRVRNNHVACRGLAMLSRHFATACIHDFTTTTG